MCYLAMEAARDEHGYILLCAEEGQAGLRQSDMRVSDLEAARQVAREINADLGLTDADIAVILGGNAAG